MKTKAVRLYGKNDLRLDEFELPKIKEDEILAKVISDSICMSSYKAACQGGAHARVPDNVLTHPVIIGHEFCGELLEIGSKWRHKFKAGQKFSIQPALNYEGSLNAIGYSYSFIGGNAEYVIIPNEVMETDCLLTYSGDAYFYGSLAEPMSCIVGSFRSSYHTTPGSYVHEMGIKKSGNLAILAGAGPMGLGAVDYAIHCESKPSLIVVTDIDDARLNRAKEILPEERATKNGVKLVYLNTTNPDALLSLTEGKGYDDVFVFAPITSVIELGDKLLAKDACLNFFAGPTNKDLSALVNFYNIHYKSTHIVGTSGGNAQDMREALEMMEKTPVDPAVMITHVGGLNAAAEATLKLPQIPGGKKLIYTHIEMPLTAISDFEELGKTDEFYERLSEIIKKHNGIWSAEAEKYLLNII